VDTTGAGDAFCGVYIAALDAGAGPAQAAELGAAAAAISTTARGARSALATRDDAEALLAASTASASEPPLENRKG
jgi:ribokinase